MFQYRTPLKCHPYPGSSLHSACCQARDEVLLQVEALHERENQVREALTAGMPVADVYKKFGVL